MFIRVHSGPGEGEKMKVTGKRFDFVMHITIPMIAAFFLCLWTVTQVYAEQLHPCVEDIEKYCNDVKPCEGHIVSCLKEHEVKLSAECKTKLEELNRKIEDIKGNCGRDIERFCKGIQPGGGRIAKCLREHNQELSEECRGKCELVKEKIEEKKQ